MGKKEKNQNLHDQVRQERKIQREESVAEERKKTSLQENSQEKEAEAKKKKKRKIAVLAGCCGVLAVASVCLITALGHPANDPQKATAVSVQSVPESSDEKSEIAEVTVTKVPERTGKKQEENANTKKDEEKKNQNKDSERKTDTKADTQADTNTVSSSEENRERQPDTVSAAPESTTISEEQRLQDETIIPAANQADSVVSEPSATAEPSSGPVVSESSESIPQETTTEITPEPTPLPHVHSWVTKFRTVHHDAVTEVVDQPAYTEPVYEEQPVYETIAVYVCDVCGEDFENVGEHSETHIDWETFTNPFHYHVEFRQGAQTGTEMVQTGSITHHEVSHIETRVVKAACDEKVPDGYVCTGCGAVK